MILEIEEKTSSLGDRVCFITVLSMTDSYSSYELVCKVSDALNASVTDTEGEEFVTGLSREEFEG